MRKIASARDAFRASIVALGLLGALLPLLSAASSTLPCASAASFCTRSTSRSTMAASTNPSGSRSRRRRCAVVHRFGNNSIGRITTTGTVTNYTGPGISNPHAIAAGPDGALWFTNQGNNSIGRITTSGTVTNYTAPASASRPAITAGPDGALWFTNFSGNNSIGRITTTGRSPTTPAPASAARPGSRPGPTAPCGSPTDGQQLDRADHHHRAVTNYTGADIS